ncbi:serine/threonine protein kinase, partial [Myxococcota bacterium]|nr:serine/threonine protein kinase [Myxococcota bacterium]
MVGAPRYRLGRLIQRGGTAELFEAWALGDGGFSRRVALKRLLEAHAADPALVDAFVDEANLTSHLHHANIVGVYDFGELDGRPFQILELVDGLDLAEVQAGLRTRGDAFPVEVALHVTAELAEALAYAHAASGADGAPLGLVHRDVTPENVLVSWAGDVKLTDFGIARAHERRARTTVNVVKGKAPFLSPEQLRGELVDARADLFALGCLLHALVAGESPTADEARRRAVVAGARPTLAR